MRYEVVSTQEDGVDDDERRDHKDQVGEPALQPVGVEAGAQLARDERGDGRSGCECPARAQSMLNPCRWDRNPAAEFATMISNDVPIAIGISTPSMSTRAGMIRNPPPTPNSPVRSPTANPAGMDRGAQRRQSMPPSALHAVPVWSFLLSIRAPASTITAAKPSNSADCGRCDPIAAPAKVAGIPAAANTPARRHCTCLARILGNAPTADATPITRSDTGIAWSMSSPTAYTRAGTARIEPPPPNNPSSTPMRAPNARARPMDTVMASRHCT